MDLSDEARRRRGGRGMETTQTEKAEIAMMKAAGDSNRAIARKTHRSRECIKRVLGSEDVEQLRIQARDILDRHQVPMAESFLEAVKVGAAKGRYEGAYHGLLSLGVISRPDDSMAGPRTVVNVGQVIVQGSPGQSLPLCEDIIDGVPVQDDEGPSR